MPDSTMNKYFLHNYRTTWIDSAGEHQSWRSIEDDYLRNIHNKIKRSQNQFPAQALYYCEREIERRRLDKASNRAIASAKYDFEYTVSVHKPFNADCFDLAAANNHYNLEKPMHKDLAERPVQTVVKVKDEELPKYFGQKVRWFETGEDFKVIGIHMSISSKKQLTLQPLKPGQSAIQLDAYEVDIVKQIAVHAYQHKNGDVTYSSVQMSAAMMKKKGIKKLESATKYFDA